MEKHCISCIHLQVQQWLSRVIILNAMVSAIYSTLTKGIFLHFINVLCIRLINFWLPTTCKLV